MSILFKVLFALSQALHRLGEEVLHFAIMREARNYPGTPITREGLVQLSSTDAPYTGGGDPWATSVCFCGSCAECLDNAHFVEQFDPNVLAAQRAADLFDPWETEQCPTCSSVVSSDGSHKCEEVETDFICASCNQSLKFDGAVRAQTNFQVYCEPCYDREHDWKVYLNDDFA